MDEVEVTVMLADISGSTALYQEVGAVEALDRVSRCLDLMRRVVDGRGGEFISSKGDDVLCVFTDPHAAIDVGVEIFEAIRDDALSLHAGVDFGAVIRARDDVFGDSVNMAARLASLANPGEILCSEAVYEQLKSPQRSMLRFFGTRHFKGAADHSTIYLFSDALPGQATEIVFAEAGGASADRGTDTCQDGAKAALRFGEETFLCTVEKTVSIGRSTSCDLVVSHPWVSRSHAVVEIRAEQVYLADNSSSGTYVQFEGQTPFLVRRESVLLPGSCALSPARLPSDPGAQVIECVVLQQDTTDALPAKEA